MYDIKVPIKNYMLYRFNIMSFLYEFIHSLKTHQLRIMIYEKEENNCQRKFGEQFRIKKYIRATDNNQEFLMRKSQKQRVFCLVKLSFKTHN